MTSAPKMRAQREGTIHISKEALTFGWKKLTNTAIIPAAAWNQEGCSAAHSSIFPKT
jgi:hypothetical protein